MPNFGISSVKVGWCFRSVSNISSIAPWSTPQQSLSPKWERSSWALLFLQVELVMEETCHCDWETTAFILTLTTSPVEELGDLNLLTLDKHCNYSGHKVQQKQVCISFQPQSHKIYIFHFQHTGQLCQSPSIWRIKLFQVHLSQDT